VCGTMLLDCAAHNAIEPIGHKKKATYVSFGGPIVKAFGTRIPLPHIVTGIRYGLRNNLDLDANLNLFTFAYGISMFEFAGTWYPLLRKGWTPTLGLDTRLITLLNFKNDVQDRFRAYPILTPSLAWNLGNGLFYTGSNITVPVSDMDFDNEISAFRLSPFLGYAWQWKPNLRLFAEIKMHGINIETHQVSIDFIKINNHGAFTPLIAMEWDF